MNTLEDALALYDRARTKCLRGQYAQALHDYARLMEPAPHAFDYYNVIQRTYIVLGLVELAKAYPPARALLDEALGAKRRALILAPGDFELQQDVDQLERGLKSL